MFFPPHTATVKRAVAPHIVEQPQGITGQVGQTVKLTCSATGIPTPDITWYQDETQIYGAIFQTLYFASVKPENRGQYYCIARNSQGSEISQTALLSLNGISYSAYLGLIFHEFREHLTLNMSCLLFCFYKRFYICEICKI